MHDLCDQGDHHEPSDSDHLHGHLHAINGYHPHNIPDHIHEMIIIVIKVIFMNLLIAIMNTTMQEVHDKKLLYWKFVRAGI